jgi:hypothetical protein
MNNTNEMKEQFINNEYDYSDKMIDFESVLKIGKQADNIYKKMLNVYEEEEKKNQLLKYEYKQYKYKNRWSTLQFVIRYKNYTSISCDSYEALIEAHNNSKLKDIAVLEIFIRLNYSKGSIFKNTMINVDNEFLIQFKPFDTKLRRRSNYNDVNMNQIEAILKSNMEQLKKVDSIFV